MGSSFGTIFRITTFGESHGGGVGVVIDGCPSLLPITEAEIQFELDRRKPGQSKIVTQRKETDTVEILSGIENGVTLGTPIALLVRNEDARSRDYDEMRDKFRPSHADFTYDEKYGIRAWSGGGRASARETIGRVAAGAIAKKLLRLGWGVEVLGWVSRVSDIEASVDESSVTLEQVESNIVRCPDTATAERMIAKIEETRKEGNSLGGVVRCIARGVPAGWGEPVFDKLEADLAKAVMSLPACKGFEVGSGFNGTYLTGKDHNDEFYADDDKHVYTPTNRSGGIQGGISNGETITLNAAFKPTATILHEQHTVNVQRENTTLAGRGRHDPCVLPRAVPMVEAMVALTLIDHALRQEAVRLQFLNRDNSESRGK
ncbi:MAG: chorismate synthase [Fimbriimonadaceae bacterium]|nr:chorismate synthase [Fimbriimonadaceae bacterium]